MDEEQTRCQIISEQFNILRDINFDKYSEASRKFDDVRFGLTAKEKNGNS